MVTLPPEKKVPQVRTFAQDVSRAQASQKLNQSKTDDYLDKALNELSNIQETRPGEKESLLASKEDDPFSLDDAPAGVIITDTKTKGGKLRAAIKKSFSGWVDEKKEKVKKIQQEPKKEEGEKISKTETRIETLKKSTSAKKLGASAIAPLKRTPVHVPEATNDGPVQIKKVEKKAASWSHVEEDDSDTNVKVDPEPLTKPRTIAKVRRKARKAPLVREEKREVQANRVVTQRTFKKNPLTSSEEKVILEKDTKAEALANLATENKITEPSAKPEIKKETAIAPATPEVSEVTEHVKAESAPTETPSAAKVVIPDVATIEAFDNQFAKVREILDRLSNGLSGVIILIVACLLVIFLSSFFGRAENETTEIVLGESLFASEYHIRVTASEPGPALANIKEQYPKHSELTAFHFTPEEISFDTWLTGMPHTFGAINNSPVLVVDAGDYETGLGNMLELEHEIPSLLLELFDIDSDRLIGSFTDAIVRNQTTRVLQTDTESGFAYTVTDSGLILIAKNKETIAELMTKTK